jgi:hypothetical protein
MALCHANPVIEQKKQCLRCSEDVKLLSAHELEPEVGLRYAVIMVCNQLVVDRNMYKIHPAHSEVESTNAVLRLPIFHISSVNDVQSIVAVTETSRSKQMTIARKMTTNPSAGAYGESYVLSFLSLKKPLITRTGRLVTELI